MTAFLIIIAVVVLLVFYVIGVYNGLKVMSVKADTAFADLDVVLKRRYDLIPNLVEVAKKQAEKLGLNAVSGLICSGDAFINGAEKIAQIRANFPQVAAVEMEAAAIAQVCHAMNMPFVVVRAISDVADKESHLSFDEFLPLAAEKSSEMVLEMLNNLS